MIDMLIDELKVLTKSKTSDTPGCKVIAWLGEEFYRQKIPLKYVGRVKMDVNEAFLAEEVKAKEVIRLFCLHLTQIRTFLEEEFGEDSEAIFGDVIYNMSITYRF